MNTCCSINCPFIGFCKYYDNTIDRTNGCKIQLWILKQVEQYKIKSKQIERRRKYFEDFNRYYYGDKQYG